VRIQSALVVCLLSACATSPGEGGTQTIGGSKAQAQNANVHQWWNTSALAWNVDQKVWSEGMSDGTYFSTYITFANVDYGAYMGYQQLGGGVRQVIFSVWNATASQAGAGANCQTFGGEGTGGQCILPFEFQNGRWYTSRMWRLSRDSSGTWWGAWILDDAGGQTYIGSHLAPPEAGDINAVDSFDEYFGEAAPCNAIPWSSATFLKPFINDRASQAGFGPTSIGNCSGGVVTENQDGTSLLALGQSN
jgi:hypothetical protein